jgi:hypothetical protein
MGRVVPVGELDFRDISRDAASGQEGSDEQNGRLHLSSVSPHDLTFKA